VEDGRWWPSARWTWTALAPARKETEAAMWRVGGHVGGQAGVPAPATVLGRVDRPAVDAAADVEEGRDLVDLRDHPAD
jgi:hypothetical protein